MFIYNINKMPLKTLKQIKDEYEITGRNQREKIIKRFGLDPKTTTKWAIESH